MFVLMDIHTTGGIQYEIYSYHHQMKIDISIDNG